jgi:hypothetical protein
MRSKAKMLGELRGMLRDVLTARTAGGSYTKLARSQGYVDGYMRALLDAGDATKDELLALVAEERAAAFGPATRDLEADAAEVAA